MLTKEDLMIKGKQDWYFTFGCGHEPYEKKYVKIHATCNAARNKMFAAFGKRWSMQYQEAEGKEVVERWNLKELNLEELERVNNFIHFTPDGEELR